MLKNHYFYITKIRFKTNQLPRFLTLLDVYVMRKILLLSFAMCFFFINSGSAQDLKPEKEVLIDTVYPYILPLWGQKVAERGYKTLLPFGLNLNYVYNNMALEISDFDLSIGGDSNSVLNSLLSEYVNLETLNFQRTEATSNGLNIRADFWLLPLLNIYGIYASSEGTTSVALQPEWYDEEGNLLLSLPKFGSSVDFTATSVGIGSTLVYGVDNYFMSVDMNYTSTSSALLEDPAQFIVASARVGTVLPSKRKDRFLAVYVGGMWRNFVEQRGNRGQISLNEVFPGLGERVFPAIDDRITSNTGQINANNVTIDGLPNTPAGNAQRIILQEQNELLNLKNQGLYELDNAMTTLVAADVNYKIKKEIINSWSVQFGFNYQINDHWMFRGEFGKASGNTFAMTGLQYRFGL
jgi:hypothetical protein